MAPTTTKPFFIPTSPRAHIRHMLCRVRSLQTPDSTKASTAPTHSSESTRPTTSTATDAAHLFGAAVTSANPFGIPVLRRVDVSKPSHSNLVIAPTERVQRSTPVDTYEPSSGCSAVYAAPHTGLDVSGAVHEFGACSGTQGRWAAGCEPVSLEARVLGRGWSGEYDVADLDEVSAADGVGLHVAPVHRHVCMCRVEHGECGVCLAARRRPGSLLAAYAYAPFLVRAAERLDAEDDAVRRVHAGPPLPGALDWREGWTAAFPSPARFFSTWGPARPPDPSHELAFRPAPAVAQLEPADPVCRRLFVSKRKAGEDGFDGFEGVVRQRQRQEEEEEE